jgi:lipopolysaccharide export system permease protein
MDRLSSYIFRQLALAGVLIVAALSAVIWLTQSLRFIDWIVNRGLPISSFVWIAMLMLPTFLAVILPIALFAATVFTYQKLQGDSEITVMRAVGVGQIRLILPALVMALIGVALSYAINLYLLPASYREFKVLQTEIRNVHTAVLLQEGVFTEIDDTVTVFVEQQQGAGAVSGIMVQDARNPEKPVTIIADRGAIVTTPTGPRIVMMKGNRQELDRATGRISFLFFERYAIDIERRLAAEQQRDLSATERFLDELWNPEPTVSERMRNSYRAEGHQRLASPLYVLGFVAIALAALLAGDFSRRAPTQRILMAVAAVATVQAVGIGVMNLGGRIPAFIPLIYLNAAAPILVAGWLLFVGPPQFGKAVPTPPDRATAPEAI